MCAIAVLINRNRKNVNKESLIKMIDVMKHRGPDAGGVYLDGYIGFGHRRLSIIDTVSSSNQPMESVDGKYVIIFNGEIYNYIELRNELISQGVVFRTESDTEVIIEMYRKYGKECTDRFNGMWAFIIYDRHQSCVFVSRDRMGVKPLYLLQNDSVLCFSSEIKAITTLFPDEKQVDEVGIARYLRGVEEDSDEHTMYKNIKNFPPAHSAVYDINTDSISFEKYWDIRAAIENHKKIRNPYKELRTLIEDSIRLRLRADVPIGVSLSGGLDSSTIVEIASKKYEKSINTFSSIYIGDKDYDEKEFIDCVNEDTKSISHYVYPDNVQNKVSDLKNMMKYRDTPPISPSPYSGFRVYNGVGNTVKVILDGQGADELFAGYYNFLDALIRQVLKKKTKIARIRAIKLIATCNAIWKKPRIISDQNCIRAVGVAGYKKYIRKGEKNKNSWIPENELYMKDFLNINLKTEFEDEKTFDNTFRQALYHAQFHGSLPRILHDVDRNSMAFSLEVRLPFLDYRIIEFSYMISDDLMFHRGFTKYVLRKSVRAYLPKKIWSRRQKLGLPTPFEKWMLLEPNKREIENLLSGFGKRGIVDNQVLQKIYKEQVLGERNNSDLLFRFIMFELWLRRDFDNADHKWKYHVHR